MNFNVFNGLKKKQKRSDLESLWQKKQKKVKKCLMNSIHSEI